MKLKPILITLVLILSLAGFSTYLYTNHTKANSSVEGKVTIQTELGKITGLSKEGVQTYLGLPYAKPPVDDLRWMPPVVWNETFDNFQATDYPNRPYGSPYIDALDHRDIPGDFSEDCLYLNIYTPEADGKERPVMFWIYGGAFIQGAANEYDGRALAKENDVVVVAINYRLGAFGFLDLSSFGDTYTGSASLGIQDQIAALEWVRDNIKDYGGDPENITIFGESAGGASVLALLAAPSAQGLFHKAIASSPGEISGLPLDNIPALQEIYGAEGEALLAILRDLPAEELLEMQVNGLINVGASIDGTILPMTPSQAILANTENGVPLLVGNNKEEGTFLVDAIPPEAYEIMSYIYGISVAGGDPTNYLASLDTLVPGGTPKDRMIRVWYDYFRASGLRAAQMSTLAGASGWNYSFEVPGNTDYGITHGSDLAFVFNALNHPGDMIFPTFHEDSEANRELALKWSKTLATFARTGNPNGAGMPEWPQYDTETRQTLILDLEPRLVEDLDGPDIRALYGLE